MYYEDLSSWNPSCTAISSVSSYASSSSSSRVASHGLGNSLNLSSHISSPLHCFLPEEQQHKFSSSHSITPSFFADIVFPNVNEEISKFFKENEVESKKSEECAESKNRCVVHDSSSSSCKNSNANLHNQESKKYETSMKQERKSEAWEMETSEKIREIKNPHQENSKYVCYYNCLRNYNNFNSSYSPLSPLISSVSSSSSSSALLTLSSPFKNFMNANCEFCPPEEEEEEMQVEMRALQEGCAQHPKKAPKNLSKKWKADINEAFDSSSKSPLIFPTASYEEEKSHDFRTIDWRHDADAYTRQVRRIRGDDKYIKNRIKMFIMKFEGWIYAALIALLTAFSAAYIDLGVSFLSDLRFGKCNSIFWLDRRYCCGSEFAVNYKLNECELFHPVSHVRPLIISSPSSTSSDLYYFNSSIDESSTASSKPLFFSSAASALQQPLGASPSSRNLFKNFLHKDSSVHPYDSAPSKNASETFSSITAKSGLLLLHLFGDSLFSSFPFNVSGKSASPSSSEATTPLSNFVWQSWSRVFGVPASNAWLDYSVNFLFYILIVLALSLSSAWLVIKFSPQAAGSGLAEVKTILGGFIMPHVLSGWTLVIKCIGLCLSVSSGMSLGKEGPMVHVACCWANLLSKLSYKYNHNEGKKRELLSAASAAGVSVAFGAPLGGVLYSLEEVSFYFPSKTLWKAFFCAVSAALCLKWIDPGGTGNLTLFQMDYISLLGSWEIVELFPFGLLGLIGGFLGGAFIHLNLLWNTAKMKINFIKKYPLIEVFIVALLTAFPNYLIPLLRENSSKSLEHLFGRCNWRRQSDLFNMCANESSATYAFSDYNVSNEICLQLFLTMLLRFVQTVFTVGLQIPAGIFIPALTIGAAYGRLMGLLVIRFNEVFCVINCHKCIHPGVYALVGAASMFAGVTRMTISLVVIMFELTGGLAYIMPFMLACIISKWVGDAVCKHSIDDCYILFKGYPYLHETEQVSFTACARDIMERKLIVLCADDVNTVGSLEKKLQNHKYSGFPVVTNKVDRTVVGYILAEDLKRILDSAFSNQNVNASTFITFFKFSRNNLFNCFGINESNVFAEAKSETTALINYSYPLVVHNVLLQRPVGFSSFKNTSSTSHSGDSIQYSFTLVSKIATVRDLEIYLHRVDFFNDNHATEKNTHHVLYNSKANPNCNFNYFHFIDLSVLVDEHSIQLLPEASLGQVYNIFKQLGIRYCLLTRHGKLEGLLTKKAFLNYI